MGTKPYTCPVCKGKTNVKKGFYADEPERTKCKACLNGIIFGYEDTYTWVPNYPNYYQFPNNLIQCSTCGTWYTGSHQCKGWQTIPGYTSPGYGYTAPPTSSNPPTVSEVETWLGGDYLHPSTISEDE